MRLPADLIQTLRPKYDGTHVCVTGGAGFIGGHLVDALHSLGAIVTIIDDLSNSDSAALAELIDIEPARVRFVHASILEPDALAEAIDQSSIVFHLAAIASVPRSIKAPERTWTVNTTGTLRVLQAAKNANANRVVLAASSAAYGGIGPLPSLESQLPAPRSPYAASKIAAEDLMTAWAHAYDLSTISLRYFNVFGPRQPADSPYSGVVALFIKKLLVGEPPTIFGDGSQTRDFTPVSNAVQATLLAGAKPDAFKGEKVNIACGRSVTLNQLLEVVAQACKVSTPEPLYRSTRQGDVKDSSADLTRASELLGYEPVCNLENGIAETVKWYKGIPVEHS